MQPNFLFKNKHFNTLYRFITNKNLVTFARERITTLDGDFIDLDFTTVNSDKIILAIHGLEGSSQSSYIQSLSFIANKQNYDVVAINLRGCSGEPNTLLASYHSGKTDDLQEVIQYIEQKKQYKKIHIIGYSLGGNLTLKLLGEAPERISKIVKSAVAVSVPCDLKGSAEILNIGFNKVYQNGILKTLKEKALQKIQQFPNAGLDENRIKKVKSFTDYDDCFTSKINNFENANDYYKKSSCKQFIKTISIPSLIINALDDSFLSNSCYPYKEVSQNDKVRLLTPKYGGHVGFYSGFNSSKNNWLEEQILDFFSNH